jgi:3-hexulose-6-phosphate synthase
VQLQVALDRLELDEAVRIADTVAAHAHWIEVGTSLVKRFGMVAVSAVADAAGDTPVLADLKTADDAATEFGMAFEAGARAATVLAMTSGPTIDRCVELADQAGAEVMLDLLAVSDRRRDALLDRLAPHVLLAAHIGKDEQDGGVGVESALGTWTTGRRIAVAGGVTLSDLPRLGALVPQVRVIVGSAITHADDPGTAAADMATAMAGITRENS